MKHECVCHNLDVYCGDCGGLIRRGKSDIEIALDGLHEATNKILQASNDRILVWLGMHRDRMPDDLVASLQRLAGVHNEEECRIINGEEQCTCTDVDTADPSQTPKAT